MAGSKRQKALRIPVLIEIAILGGEVDARRWGREKAKDVEDLLNWALSFFSFSSSEKRERASNGEPKLENDARWAAKQLEEDGFLKRQKNERWSITNDGLKYLRTYIATLLRKKLSDEELDCLMMARNYNDEELLLQSLKIIAEASINLPNYSLEATVVAGHSLRHVFRNAMANLPLDEVGNMLVYGYEQLKPYISRDLAHQYNLVAA